MKRAQVEYGSTRPAGARPRGGRSWRALALVAALAIVLPGCGGGSNSDSSDEDATATRSYGMGFFLVAPEPDEQVIVNTLQAMADVADVVLMQEPPPWERLLEANGDVVSDVDAVIDAVIQEKIQVRDFVVSLGMELAYLADPLDGLDRLSETPELTDRGRSIMEPGIRALHEQWVRAVAEHVQPRWFGLASEINTLGQHGDPALYAELVDVINTLAPDIRAAVPGARIFVSFQVEDAHGLIFPNDPDGFGLIGDFDIDVLGLSSYPVFNFETPADIPDDHLSRFTEETDLPLAMVEGGWSSADVQFGEADPAEQVAYIERYSELLKEVDARLWVLLLYADLNVAALGLPPDREETLKNFAHMGIVDENLNPKASFEPWQQTFERERVEH